MLFFRNGYIFGSLKDYLCNNAREVKVYGF